MTDLLKVKAIRERINRGNSTGDEKWLVSEVERLSRIEAAAVAYRDATVAIDREPDDAAALGLSLIQMKREQALFATLPSSEETRRG